MTTEIDALKKQFRDGQREEAIAACEALLLRHPGQREARKLCAMMNVMARNYPRAAQLLLEVLAETPTDADALFNLGMCERELKNYEAAARHFKAYADRLPKQADGWASLAECKFLLNDFPQGVALADRALQLEPGCVPAWTVRGNSQKGLGKFEEALASFGHAIQLAPKLPELRVQRGELLDNLGRLEQAAEDYKAALALTPADAATLKKATLCMLQLDQGHEAIALCREILKTQPDNLTAKLGVEWLLSQMVPLWHVPMMNEEERNQPYFDALKAAVTPEKVVFEVGTGSGLLAMMAARLGAAHVVTCEAVRLVADTAAKIVENNGLQGKVTVLAKPSYAVQIGKDLPQQADILVHEVFSSELLGEHVLPALEDAKARLLKPGGQVLPASGSIMVALVGGDELGKELHVEQAFGFDLSAFNAIHPKKRPIHREDLPRILLSEGAEAFRFDFQNQASFPAEKKRMELTVTQGGRCWGVIQWIRFEFGQGVFFENHPTHRRPVASWQHTIYRFDAPLRLEPGATVAVDATHDRSRPWFSLATVT